MKTLIVETVESPTKLNGCYVTRYWWSAKLILGDTLGDTHVINFELNNHKKFLTREDALADAKHAAELIGAMFVENGE